ncbi:MAG: DUF6273 domain-containing protein, partial [Coriobacteriales bacterium]|nr:DUF6273 domain-containing protein [Coriobacteriales bacterium]
HNGYQELTNQKLFLLSEEEVFRTIAYSTTTTDVASLDLTQNLYGSSVVLFADVYARRTPGISIYHWLRSPRYIASRAAVVDASTGTATNIVVDYLGGARPAFRMDLS